MAGLDPRNLCKTFELELQKITGCIYDNIETGRNTYKVAEAIETHTRTDLTEVVGSLPNYPGDPDCDIVRMDVKYRVPDCTQEAAGCDTVSLNCTSVETAKEEYKICPVTINDCVADQFTVSADAFDCDCNSTVTEELALKLAKSVRKGYAQYNRILAESLITGAGTGYDGEDVLKLKLFKEDKDGCLQPQPMGTYALEREYRKQSPNCTDRPIVITGSEKVATYNHAVSNGYFTGTQTTAANASPLGSNFYFDPEIAKLMKASPADSCEGAFSFLPGSVSLLEWFCFDNPNYQTMPGNRVAWAPQFVGNRVVRQKVDIGTPILGTPFVVDLFIYYDECDGLKSGSVTYKWKKRFGLFKLPQEALCPDRNFNFCNLWDVVCEPYTCADSCTPCDDEVVEP